MSGLTPQAAAAEPAAGSDEHDERALAVREGLTSLSVVLVWFGVAALIGAVVWWQVTPLAEYTRTADGGALDEEQLSKQFSSDGWFFVVAAVAGLVSGLLLVLLRRRNPVLMVVLVALGGAFATFVMVQVGLALGPGDPGKALATTAVGDTVPLRLRIEAHGLWFVWSIAALLGAIGALWITEARADAQAQRAAAYGPGDHQQWVRNQR